MFSLITVIVSVVLVVALLMVTMYHGGDTLEKSRADARAAEIIQQGQQLTGAAVIYNAQTGSWPQSIQVLLDEGYLKNLPGVQLAAIQPKFELISSAYAADIAYWEMPLAGQPTFKLSLPVPELDCRAINKHVRGDDGILTKATREKSAQCYGDNGALTVVVNADGSSLDGALPSDSILEVQSGGTGFDGKVTLSDVLGDTSSAYWLVAPGSVDSAQASVPPAVGKGAWQFASEVNHYNASDVSWLGFSAPVTMTQAPHFSFNDSNSGPGIMPSYGSIFVGNFSGPEGQSLEVTSVSVTYRAANLYTNYADGLAVLIGSYLGVPGNIWYNYASPAEVPALGRDEFALRWIILSKLSGNNDSRAWLPDSSLIPLDDPRFQSCAGYPQYLSNGFKVICQKFGDEESGPYFSGGLLSMTLADAQPTTVNGMASCYGNVCSIYAPNQGNYFYDTADIVVSYTLNGVPMEETTTVRVQSYDRNTAPPGNSGPPLAS